MGDAEKRIPGEGGATSDLDGGQESENLAKKEPNPAEAIDSDARGGVDSHECRQAPESELAHAAADVQDLLHQAAGNIKLPSTLIELISQRDRILLATEAVFRIALERRFSEFIDRTKNPSIIAANFMESLAGNSDQFRPIRVDVHDHRRELRENASRYITKSVFAVSAGGTTVNKGRAYTSTKEDRLPELQSFESRDIKRGDEIPSFSNPNEFWDAVLSGGDGDFVQNLKTAYAGHLQDRPVVGLTLGYPINMTSATNGRIAHFAGKINCPGLAPLNEEEMRGLGPACHDRPTIGKSFCNYMRSKGIDVNASDVIVSPNDSVPAAVVLAQPLFIAGTGSNTFLPDGGNLGVGLASINTESGHYIGYQPSRFEQIAGKKRGIVPKFESFVSGQMMSDSFKVCLAELLGDRHDLARRLSGDDLTPLIFALAYDEKANLTKSDLTENERFFLRLVAKYFVDRAAVYTATMLTGLQAAIGSCTPFIAEGSLVGKNPPYLADINARARKLREGGDILVAKSLPLTNSTGSDEVEKKADLSFAGTFKFALAGWLVNHDRQLP